MPNLSVKMISMRDNIQKYRYLSRFIPSSSDRSLVILTGARQTGKTTLAKHKYSDLKYVSLDAPENRDALRTQSTSLWHKDIGNAVLDEVQKEPIVFDKLKYAFDEGLISFSILLGSSQILLLKRIRESLAGRVSLYELWPLMMSEFYRSAGSADAEFPVVDRLLSSEGDIDNIMASMPSVLLESEDGAFRQAEDHLLSWGGMPALLPLQDEARWQWLKDYGFTYLERDLTDLARLADLMPFRKFQRLSALRTGALLNYSEIARDASVSASTAKRYLEYLILSYQAILLQPYFRNLTSSVVKAPKLYFVDVGIARSLSGFRGDATGEIYETMVVAELTKWIRTARRNVEMFFYRTRSGLELDLLLETESGMIGVEIKARKRLAPKDIAAMKAVAEGLGEEWRGGLVIYLGDETRRLSDPSIWAVPSRRLFI
jgi:hypothetical protein